MSVYPNNFEQKIGFDKIRKLLEEQCISELGLEYVRKISFTTRFDKLNNYLHQTSEFKTILMLENPFPSQDYIDLRSELKQLQIIGAYITLEGLSKFNSSYKTFVEICKYFQALSLDLYPNVESLYHRICVVALAEQDIFVKEDDPEISKQLLSTSTQILKELSKIIDDFGNIKDNASERLSEIRSKIRKKQNEAQKNIKRYLNEAKKEGWVKDDADFSIRNDRMVVPVVASHKRKLRGFIHDVSATGQTVFMEPEEIFNINNEIAELHNDERLEIIEILKTFSEYLKPFIPSLFKQYNFMGLIDYLRAKAKLALILEAGMPILNNTTCINWQKARHPILYLSLKAQKKPIVPLDLRLDAQEHIVIISGPNAGGKSVCLKTVGLLQYMLQCGLLVPMSETSEVGIFNSIFLDIGDEQSIENDLSTYSSHLKNMKHWVDNVSNKTLFLSDELGSGTEPQLGGSIAETILEVMSEKGAYGIVTTHYTNLKLMAKAHTNIVNGAMLFNKQELKPLYIFKKGLPGSSFAIEMAKNIGMPDYLLERASQKVGTQHFKFEEELQQIEAEKQSLYTKQREVNLADELLAKVVDKYTKLTTELESKKLQIIKQAKEDALQIVKTANTKIEKAIKDIKEANAEKQKTVEIRKEFVKESLEILGEEIEGNMPTIPVKEIEKKKVKANLKADVNVGKIELGDYVRVKEGSSVGKVVEMKQKNCKVDFDYMSINLKVENLIKLSTAELKQYLNKKPKDKVVVENINENKLKFSSNIDVRGKRSDEITELIYKFLDEAVLFGEKELQILHGKGNGVLRQLIREILSKSSLVKSFSDQKEEFGGAGITILSIY